MNKLTQKELDGVPLRSMCGEEHELEKTQFIQQIKDGRWEEEALGGTFFELTEPHRNGMLQTTKKDATG